jgi:polysaccharide biosynthesis transport protein
MRLLRKYGLWIICATIACAAGAWIVGTHRPVQYTSTASVDVEAAAIPGSVPTVVNMATEKEVASAGVVLAKAAPLVGMSPGQLAGHVATSVPSAANVLTIACTMPNPAAAQRCAQAVTVAYVNFRNDVAANPATRARDPLNVTLVTPAERPAVPSGLRLNVLLALGALIGLAVGAGTAFIRDRVDDRVRDRDDLEACLDAPVLAAVPRVRRAAGAASVVTAAPNSPVAEAFRYLRAHIEPLISPAHGGGKVVLVTGAQRLEGRTCIASNLAVALAQAGTRALLVDADVRHPSLAQMFEAGERPGLTDLLAGQTALENVVVRTAMPTLQLVTAGREADQQTDLFHAASLARVIDGLRTAADVVIVDGGAALSVSGPIALAPLSDLVVFVANVRRSRREDIRAAARELSTTASVTLVGVLAGVPRALALPGSASRQAARHESVCTAAASLEVARPGTAAEAAVIGGRATAPAAASATRTAAARGNGADHQVAVAELDHRVKSTSTAAEDAQR